MLVRVMLVLYSPFYDILEAELTILKFTAEWMVVAIGLELVYVRIRDVKINGIC